VKEALRQVRDDRETEKMESSSKANVLTYIAFHNPEPIPA
jgi:hypothetical protein